MRLGIQILSTPFVVFSHIAESINLWGLKSDIALCLQVVDSKLSQPIPIKFIDSLVVAEDRRNAWHPGVDPIGMLRAILSRFRNKGIQGASTIEQQFVRVVTNSYEMKMRRKFKEQALAIAVSRRRSKVQIASAYLSIAHYGYRRYGKSGLKVLCGEKLWGCPERKIHESIARIKYPEPHEPSEIWKKRLAMRANYIMCRTQNENFRGKFRFDAFKIIDQIFSSFAELEQKEVNPLTKPDYHVETGR